MLIEGLNREADNLSMFPDPLVFFFPSCFLFHLCLNMLKLIGLLVLCFIVRFVPCNEKQPLK